MKKCLLAAVLVFVVFCFSPSANGQTGVLDVTFGVGGKVIVPPDSSNPQTQFAIALQPDGKIITAITYAYNKVLFSRFNGDGSPDLFFGTSGKVVIPYWGYATYSVASLAVQPDGKIVAAGSDYSGSVIMIRLMPNGVLDSSFDGDGQLTTPYLIYPRSYVYKVLVKPGGKIVTVGIITRNSDTYYQLMQFMPDGKMDSSFAINGIFEYQCGYMASAKDAILLPSGKILLGGTVNPNFLYGSLTLMQLLPNGVLDSTYGTNGVAFSDSYLWGQVWSTVIAMQSDGKIVAAGHYLHVVGSSYEKVEVARFKVSGKPDSSFGYLGISSATFRHDSDYVSGIHVQPDGKILVTGSTDGKTFSILRLLPNGVVDSSYGRRGTVNIIMSNVQAYCRASVLQPDGKLVLSGYDSPTASAADNVKQILARFDVNPYVRYNTFKGAVYLDRNSNGTKDAAEPYFDYATIICNKNPYSTYIQTANGQFNSEELDTGSYVCAPTLFKPYYNGVPASHTVTNSTYFNTDSVLFALQPLIGKHDLSIHVGCARVKPGFSFLVPVIFKNEGTDTATATVEFIKHPGLTYVSSFPTATSVNNDTIRWTITNLYPLETKTIILNMQGKMPPALNVGDVIESTVSISAQNDLYPSDNSTLLVQLVRNSLDPNDKTENHGGKITTTQVTAGDYLQYTVRFQNTGNDTAFNVYIHDTLDNKLDWSTMQILTASHNYQMTMTDGNKCLFTFRNINLVDSNTNEPGSHGYIVYRIKPKATVQVGDIITNTAAIYFDYNLPIYTNTEMTTVVAESFPLKLLTFTAARRSSSSAIGGSGEVFLQWTTANEINLDHFIVERSLNGRDFTAIGTVKAINTGNYSYTDNNPTTTPNSKPQTIFYRLKMLDKDGQFTYSPIRQINPQPSTLNLVVYPNPAKDNLQVEINSDKKASLQLQVLSMDGKVIMSNSLNAVEGSILRSINISGLQKGNYLLKVRSADKEESMVRFEKL